MDFDDRAAPVNEPELRRLMRTVPLATPVTVVR
jgi:hypothetical protein